MKHLCAWGAAGWLLAFVMPAPLSAQSTQAPASAPVSRFQFGPLGVTPTFTLSNVGVDTNVFNDQSTPQRDFTATLGPGALTALRVGRAYFTGHTVGEWLYFVKSTKQRSANFNQDVDVRMPLSYLTPRIGGTYGTTRQRLNAEIDARTRRKDKLLFAGTQVRFSARTSVDLEWNRRKFEMSDDQFLGINLRQELNRTTTVESASLEYKLTPLTTWKVRTEYSSDRFEFSSIRNSDSIRVMSGVTMKPLALFAGEALVGVRVFKPTSATVEPFTGVVSAVTMVYNARESTRFNFRVDRDVDYSFQPETPYFVMRNLTLGLTQVLGGVWDIGGSVGQVQLDYRGLKNGSVLIPPRDRSITYHTTAGHHFGAGTRLGFDVDYVRRSSTSIGRNYDGLRAGASFTYGL